jgi:NAD(P)-dependent dehydrogenase (short-subunit alcohol dehydrogenase family)
MELSSSIAAIVTGGASGLGEATARQLADGGVKVAIFDLNEERGQKVAEELGGVFAKVDVSSDESVAAGFEAARGAHGQERILINCAGIGAAMKTAGRKKDTGEIQGHRMDVFEKVIQVNLLGSFRCIAKFAEGVLALDPVTESGERGVIVNTASVAAQDGQIGQAAYSASKGGIVGMTLPIARDLSREGVRCCTILPGIFDTPLMQGAPDNVKQALAASIPFPSRFGKPDEYGRLARHICENEMLNGESIRIDGAIRMAPR